MPPKKDTTHTSSLPARGGGGGGGISGGSRQTHGSTERAGRGSRSELVREKTVPLSSKAYKELEEIRASREEIEDALVEVDMRIYDLESHFLAQCIELGGSLFDGFELERRSFIHSGPAIVCASSPLAPSSSSSSAAAAATATTTATAVIASGSPTSAPTMGGFSARLAGSSSFLSNGTAASSTGAATTAPAYGYGATNGGGGALPFHTMSSADAGLALHARLHTFTPNERVFTASSVGALARVELAKSTRQQRGGWRGASAGTRRQQQQTSSAQLGSEDRWQLGKRRRGTVEEEDDQGGVTTARRGRRVQS